jgi:hypothetical protein
MEQYLGAFAYSRRATLTFPPSACQHLLKGLTLDGFPQNLILWTFMKICRENLNFLKIGHNIGYFVCNCKKASLLPPTLNRHKGALFYWNGIGLWHLPSECPFDCLSACPHIFMSMSTHAPYTEYSHLGQPRIYNSKAPKYYVICTLPILLF